MNRKGFTLIELLIVVVIIGILAAIAIPKFANTKEKAYLASMKSDLRNLVTAQEAFFADSTTYWVGNVPPAGITGAFNFAPSAGVTGIAVTSPAAGAWDATATHNATGKTCSIWVGGAQRTVGAALADKEGEPKCEK